MLSQKDHIILSVNVNNLQFLVMSQSIQNVIFCEAPVAVSGWMHLLELINDHILIHLLQLLLLHDISDVINYTRHGVFVSETIILF